MTNATLLRSRAELEPAVCLFKGLADPARLSILRLLMTGEKKVVELTTQLALAQSTVSQHLACLRECGLVTVRPQGRSSMYALTRLELIDLLSAAEQLLTAAGDDVVLCPTYGVDRRNA